MHFQFLDKYFAISIKMQDKQIEDGNNLEDLCGGASRKWQEQTCSLSALLYTPKCVGGPWRAADVYEQYEYFEEKKQTFYS